MEGGDRDYSTPVQGQPQSFQNNQETPKTSAILIGADNPSQRQWSKCLIPTDLIYKKTCEQAQTNEKWSMVC